MMKVRLAKVILIVFLLMPVVESINGYFYEMNISDMYRLFIFILIAWYFLRYVKYLSSNVFKLMFVACTMLVLLLLQFFLFHKNQEVFLSDIKSTLRILLTPIYVVFFYEAMRSKTINRENLRRLILGYSLLYGLLVIVPYLQGVGYLSYDFDRNGLMSKMSEANGIGCKGYFIELNSLIAILSVCSFFLKDMIIHTINKKQNGQMLFVAIIYLLLITTLFITATKLGIVLALLCTGILIIQILRCQRIFRYKLGIILFISCFLLFVRFFLGNLFTEVFSRLDYFYKQSDGDVLNVITSNRFRYLIESMQQIDQSSHSWFIDLFGAGYSSSFVLDGFKRRIVEMDWFDLYFSYGIIGFTAYLYFFKDAIFSLFVSKNNEMKNMLLIFFMYSFLGGHVIVNSMTATFLAICLSYSYEI
ncbi:O-antigen ligase family protein [Enterococcus sp. DIV1283b]|uniref:O-antigen ligase family protein n=1 Tax=Enterococcus sp. DIV1283b TaxID=2774745 RepID=UPI003F20FE0C